MKRRIFLSILLAATVCIASTVLWAQDSVEEPSTDKLFPAEVSFDHDGVSYELAVSGLTVRKKMFFKVYGIAHYMNATGFENEEAAIEAALSDEHAKQITMDFSRCVDAEKIQNAYRDGFKKNASEEEMTEITDLVDQFVGYFETEVEEDEIYILRWLPGGIVLTTVTGAEMEPIINTTFATLLWKIWLGDDSIVDEKKLVKMAVAEE